jgi:thiamine pyrophosphokinase
MDYAHLFKRVEMLSDYGLFTPILETTTFASYPGQQISIFVLYPEGEISTEGLRWPIRHGGKELSTRLWETNSLSLSPRIAG